MDGVCQKEMIFETLKKQGYKLTKQRKLIIDSILKNDCTYCKEIFWEVSKKDASIGISTVYRMVSILEEIGVFNPKNRYRSTLFDLLNQENFYEVILKNKEIIHLSSEQWLQVIQTGLATLQDVSQEEIASIMIKNKR